MCVWCVGVKWAFLPRVSGGISLSDGDGKTRVKEGDDILEKMGERESERELGKSCVSVCVRERRRGMAKMNRDEFISSFKSFSYI